MVDSRKLTRLWQASREAWRACPRGSRLTADLASLRLDHAGDQVGLRESRFQAWSGAAANAAVRFALSISVVSTAGRSGQPKLDYEWFYQTDTNTYYYWSNVCGTGTWTFNPAGPGGYGNFLYEIRMPTSPYHRIWLHQYANGSGLTACLYSTGNDIEIPSIPAWESQPGNVQVSANTSPC